QAGCYKISFGVETLSNHLQKDILKPIAIKRLKRTFELCHKYGIIPRALIMIGIPGQTKEDIEDTFARLSEWNVEIRAKEYFPYNDVLRNPDVSMDDIRKFDRSIFYHYPIEGIDYPQFLNLLYGNKDE